MLSATQEILVYREGVTEPKAVLWDDFRTDFKGKQDWLEKVEEALLDRECWEGSNGGPNDIVKVALSQRWAL
jgi:hypothetical protein